MGDDTGSLKETLTGVLPRGRLVMRIRTAYIPEFRATVVLRRAPIRAKRLPAACRAAFPALPRRAMSIARRLRAEIRRAGRKPTGSVRIVGRKPEHVLRSAAQTRIIGRQALRSPGAIRVRRGKSALRAPFGDGFWRFCA